MHEVKYCEKYINEVCQYKRTKYALKVYNNQKSYNHAMVFCITLKIWKRKLFKLNQAISAACGWREAGVRRSN